MGYQPPRQPVPPNGYSGVYGFSGLSGYSSIAGYSGSYWDEFDETFKSFDETFKQFDETFKQFDNVFKNPSLQSELKVVNIRGPKVETVKKKEFKFSIPKIQIPKIVFYFLIPILMGSATILLLRILERIAIK